MREDNKNGAPPLGACRVGSNFSFPSSRVPALPNRLKRGGKIKWNQVKKIRDAKEEAHGPRPHCLPLLSPAPAPLSTAAILLINFNLPKD